MGAHLVEPGAVLADRYVVEDLLAEEGESDSWRARDKILARSVVLAVLPSSSRYAPDLLAAAKRASRVADPRILQVLDAVDDGELSYVVREWATGQSLDVVLSEGPLAARRATWLMREVAAAMSQRAPHRPPAPTARPRHRRRDEVEWHQADRARHVRGPAHRASTPRTTRSPRTGHPRPRPAAVRLPDRPLARRSDLRPSRTRPPSTAGCCARARCGPASRAHLDAALRPDPRSAVRATASRSRSVDEVNDQLTSILDEEGFTGGSVGLAAPANPASPARGRAAARAATA